MSRMDRAISILLHKFRNDRHDAERTVILMYHSISYQGEANRHPYFDTVTSPEIFANHMKWIHEEGAHVLPLRMWNMDLTHKNPLKIVITFDDAFDDFYTHAFPVLHHYGFPSTMFVPTGLVGKQSPLADGINHMDKKQLRHIAAHGVEIGSHTVNHPDMSRLSEQQIAFEMQQSSEHINKIVGYAPVSFACPYAYPENHKPVIHAINRSLHASHYRIAVTTRIGSVHMNDNPLSLRRIPVNGKDDKDLFMAKLHGCYDWLYTFQSIAKRIKHPRRQDKVR